MASPNNKTTSVFNYLNYRTFLKDRFAELQRTKVHFSFRNFARLAGTGSPGYLRMLMDGQRNLGHAGIQMVTRGFRLNEEERDYFEALVFFNQAKTIQEKDRYFQILSKHKKFLKAKPLAASHYDVLSRWYCVAILEIIRLKTAKIKNASWIQRELNPPVGIREIKKAIKDLRQLGLLTIDKKGSLHRKDEMLTTDNDVRSLAVANYHTQMGELALRAARKESAKDREFSALTIGLSEKGFLEFKRRIRLFRDEIHSALEQENGNGDDEKHIVAQMNMQLFKLNKPNREKRERL